MAIRGVLPRLFLPLLAAWVLAPMAIAAADGVWLPLGTMGKAPRQIPKSIAIAAANNHVLAVSEEGRVFGWGSDDNGILNIPADLTGVTAIAAGLYTAAALRTDGTVVSWAGGGAPAGLSGVTAIAAGNMHLLALKDDGTVVVWGNTNDGRGDIPAGLSGITRIACGAFHSLALKSDGTVVAWGDNTHGQCTVPAGLTDVIAITAATFWSGAVRSDGSAVFWGYTGDLTDIPSGLAGTSALAANTWAGYFALALQSDGSVAYLGDPASPAARIPAGLTDVIALAAGSHAGVALRSDHSVVTWGRYEDGLVAPPTDLADATSLATDGDHTLVRHVDGTVTAWGYDYDGVTAIPTGLANVQQVAVRWGESLALRNDGSVVGWGSTSSFPRPAGLAGVTAVATSVFASFAVKNDGTVVAWGQDNDGLITDVGSLTQVSAIAACSMHAFALHQDGHVTAWGSSTDVPHLPASIAQAQEIVTGLDFAMVRHANGRLTTWGADESSLAAFASAQRYVTALAAANHQALVLHADGSVALWSDSRYTYPERDLPSGLAGVTAIAAGGDSLFVRIPARLPARITLADAIIIDDGLPHALRPSVDQGLFATAITYNGSPTPPTAAGDYTVVATADFWSYYGQTTATLHIRTLAATVTITAPPVIADGQAHPPTITVDPPAALPALAVTYQAYDADPAHGGTLTGTPTSQPPSDPGWYLVTATVLDGTYGGQSTSLLVIAAPQGGGSGGGSGGGGGGCGAGAAGLLLLAAFGLRLRRSCA